jgi:serine/threonine protein kinase
MLTRLIGQTLDGKYYLDKLLGQGGMGAVFLATHLGTKRPVALKVIAPQFTSNEEVGERFRREAEAAGRLRHPNVVNVTDFGVTILEKDQLAYLVMEYLDGLSLGEMLKEKGQLPLNFVVDLVEQICLAIGNAHNLGIIHRDLKPDNIWLQPDGRGSYNVKVLDFGLAKLRDASPTEEGESLPSGPTLPTRAMAENAQTRGAARLTQAQPAADEEAATRLQIADPEPEAATLLQPSATAEIEAATLIQPPATTAEVESATLIQTPAGGAREENRRGAVADEAVTQLQPLAVNPTEEAATLIQPAEEATRIQLVPAEAPGDEEAATRIQPAPGVTGNGSLAQANSGGAASQQSGSRTATTKSSGNQTVDLNNAATVELTRFGSILGTPLYMSPEQCRGEALDPRSDIYSLGVIVYQMLAGELPFAGSMTELIAKHSEAPPPPLKEKRTDIPNSLAALVMSTLEKSPESRPPTAETFATALRATAEDEAEILKQAKALYYASQKNFFVLSLMIYGPLGALSIGSSLLLNRLLSRSTPAALTYYLVLFLVIQIASKFNLALFTYVVEELRLTPTAAINRKEILKRAVRRFPRLLASSLLSLLQIGLAAVKFLLPGVKKYVDQVLLGPIVALEDHQPAAVLKRSESLVQSLRPVARSLAARDFGISFVSVVAFPFIMSLMALLFDGARINALLIIKLTMIRNFVAGYSWFIMVIMHTVYAAVPLALLYFKAKQANGETLDRLSTHDWQSETQKRSDKMGKATLAWLGIPLAMFLFLLVISLITISQGSGGSIMPAVREGRTATVKRLLAGGADADEMRFGGTTALMFAAQDGRDEMVRALLEAGARVNKRDSDGDEPLMYAAIHGRSEVAGTLLANGANVDAQNDSGTNALIAAAFRGHTATVSVLLAARANVNLRDRQGRTALMQAEAEGYEEIAERLRAAGANQ